MQTLYDFMRKYKREDGSELCEMFVRAPKRRNDPQYYEVVSDPIDMLRIQQKLKTEEYNSMHQLKEDFEKLLANALLYYKKGTAEFKDATELKELFVKAYELVEAGEDPVAKLGDREESDEAEVHEMCQDLFASIVTATDTSDTNRLLHLAFRLLPSKNRYPEYYKVIADPVDLKMIACKIQESEYSSLNELDDDLQTMCRNAMTFNEPGSVIYKDARSITKIIKAKKMELEAMKVARENRGSRVTRRLQQNKKHYTSEIANLTYEDSESEESSEEEYDTDDPLWTLYQHVRHYKSTTGIDYSEPFLQLPSKREFADYYITIGDPISLNEIRKKLKAGEYDSLSSLYEDLDLMFENCKEYNRPDSRLYKDGVKLQRAAKAKFEELGGSDDGDGSDDDDEDDDDEEEVDEDDEDEDEDEPLAVTTPRVVGLKKVLRALYNSIYRYRNKDGIQLIGVFIQKPSKKDYPDYYTVITQPMDMKTIDEKVKRNAYANVEEFLADAKLMFNNCRRYNEEGSDIYEDANALEKILMAKVREMSLTHPTLVKKPAGMAAGAAGAAGQAGVAAVPVGGGVPMGVAKRPPLTGKALQDKMKQLLDKIRDFKDAKGRQLSLIFLRLPNPKDFPDYYEVIKKPVDFERISAKVKQGAYRSMDECLADFVLMFDNASKYNEPDSQIYKDALTLQSAAKQECRALLQEDEDDGAVPDVNAGVQDIINNIFVSLYNHKDAEERCYSDSLAELPEHDVDKEGKKTRCLNLDLIKRRLDRGLYKRLDYFQRDIFAVLERARQLSRTDSQIFEDAVELQRHFVQIRDEFCEHGQRLQSRALLYSQINLKINVDDLRKAKLKGEVPEEGSEEKEKQQQLQMAQQQGISGEAGSIIFGQEQYHIGDFVYTVPVGNAAAGNADKKIFLIEKIYRSATTGVQMISGNQFFRPVETFHVPTRKFLEREVFRTDVHEDFEFALISGRCFVMNVKDYFRSAPNGFREEDVFVCESRYNSRARNFKKMKLFWNVPGHIQFVARAKPLEPTRVMSIFKERIEKHKEEIEELEALEKSVDIPMATNVVWTPTAAEMAETTLPGGEGSTYFEQYTIPGPITLRRGDCVYVRAENGKNLIAQIDTMWTNPGDNMAYFHGPWFVTPSETPCSPTQLFYKQEAFISTIQDSNPLLSVVGRCSVLEGEEYKSMRPTHHEEVDVYICESVYDESRRQIRPLPPTGLKTYEHNSLQVVSDEVYYFKRKIVVAKKTLSASASGSSCISSGGVDQKDTTANGTIVPGQSPLVIVNPSTPVSSIGGIAMETENEDSMDAPPSMGSTEAGPAGPLAVAANAAMANAAAAASAATPSVATPTTTPSGGKKSQKPRIKTGYQVFSSELWNKVKATMGSEATFGSIIRVIADKWRAMSDVDKAVYEEKCKKLNREYAAKMAAADGANERKVYKNIKKNVVEGISNIASPSSGATPTTIPLQPNNSGVPQLPNKPVSPNTSQLMGQLPPGATGAGAAAAGGATAAAAAAAAAPAPPKPVEPIFHTVPPRSQRLLHSEAYIRYIEGLTSDSQAMCNWDKQLNASKENTRTEEARLPAHWLADNGDHGTSLDALWALRDFLVQDSLNVVKISYNNF